MIVRKEVMRSPVITFANYFHQEAALSHSTHTCRYTHFYNRKTAMVWEEFVTLLVGHDQLNLNIARKMSNYMQNW